MKAWQKSVILFGVVLTFGLTSADLPSEIKKCAIGDTECIKNVIPTILKAFPKGDSRFGLPNVSELKMKNVVVARPHGGKSMQLDLKFNTMTVSGMEDTKFTRIVGFEKDPRKSKFEIEGVVPNLRIAGDYEAKGQVLVLPINSKGHGEIKFKNVRAGFKIKFNVEERNGKTYLKIADMKAKVEPENMQLNFENIFAGNKELTDNLNKMINENWKLLFDDIAEDVGKAFIEIVSFVTQSVLDTLPYEDAFKKDE